MLTLKRKTAYQKFYLMKLKTYTNNFLTNYKKRYSLFPWSKVLQVSKMQLKSNTPIVVAGHKYSVKEMVAKISKIKLELREKQRISYYNYIFNGFKKASDGKLSIETKDIYLQSKEELDKIFLSMKEDLKFCLNGLREINKSLKAETIKTESEEYIMSYPNVENLFTEFMHEVEEDIKDKLLEAYEYVIDNDDLFSDEEIVEGANTDMVKSYRTALKAFRPKAKQCRKAMKEGNFTEAKAIVKELEELVNKLESDIDDIHSDEWSATFSTIISILKLVVTIFIMFIPTTAYIKSGKATVSTASILMNGSIGASVGVMTAHAIDSGIGLQKELEKDLGKSTKMDKMNNHKIIINSRISSLKAMIKSYEQKIEDLEKKSKEQQIEQRKEEKLAKESTHFNEERLKIYQACESGEINEEEREILLEELRNEMALTESTIELEASEEPLSKREKYDRIKSILYEKCGNGEISEEEREDMMRKAYDKIFEAGNENSNAKIQAGKNMAAAKEANEQQKVFNKEASSTEKEINDQAGSIMKDTKI